MAVEAAVVSVGTTPVALHTEQAKITVAVSVPTGGNSLPRSGRCHLGHGIPAGGRRQDLVRPRAWRRHARRHRLRNAERERAEGERMSGGISFPGGGSGGSLDEAAVGEIAVDAVAEALVPGAGIVVDVSTPGEISLEVGNDLTSRLSYPSLPGISVRMFRTSGSTSFPLTGGTFTELDSGQIADMNDDDGGWTIERGSIAGSGNSYALVVVFPVPVDIGSVYIINQWGGSDSIFYSADTNDGSDGTWVSATATGMHTAQTELASPIEGVKAIGFQLYAEYFWNNFRFSELRLWGAAADTINPNLLVSGDEGQSMKVVDGTPAWSNAGQFKQTVWAPSGAVSTSSTSFVDIDNTGLPALSLDLAVGDVVHLSLKANILNDNDGNVVAFDWDIDQPTSANTNIRTITGMAYADYMVQRGNGYGVTTTIEASFTATEAGVHTFQPQWLVSASTGRLHQTSYPHTMPITHRVENLGRVTP